MIGWQVALRSGRWLDVTIASVASTCLMAFDAVRGSLSTCVPLPVSAIALRYLPSLLGLCRVLTMSIFCTIVLQLTNVSSKTIDSSGKRPSHRSCVQYSTTFHKIRCENIGFETPRQMAKTKLSLSFPDEVVIYLF